MTDEKAFSDVSDEKLTQLITTTPVLPEPEPPMSVNGLHAQFQRRRDAVYGRRLDRAGIQQGVKRIRTSWGINRQLRRKNNESD